MYFELKPLAEIAIYLPTVFETKFKFDALLSADSMKGLDWMFSQFITGIWAGFESQYIDKLYRDAYYNYYSSKLQAYSRDCIRLSFFSSEVTLGRFPVRSRCIKITVAVQRICCGAANPAECYRQECTTSIHL